jgi:cytochrome P450 family 6
MEFVSFSGFVVTVLFLLNHFFHHHWQRRGFPQLKPRFLVGDIGDLFRLKKSIAEIYGELYAKSKKLKVVGLYFLYRPALLINDTKLIQSILVKDFPYFMNHGLYVDEKRDPLSGHLFSLHDDKWKNLRTKISPLFSPVKLKLMFPTFLDCAVNLQKHVEQCMSSEKNVIEIRDLMARYTT